MADTTVPPTTPEHLPASALTEGQWYRQQAGKPISDSSTFRVIAVAPLGDGVNRRGTALMYESEEGVFPTTVPAGSGASFRPATDAEIDWVVEWRKRSGVVNTLMEIADAFRDPNMPLPRGATLYLSATYGTADDARKVADRLGLVVDEDDEAGRLNAHTDAHTGDHTGVYVSVAAYPKRG